MTDRGSLGVHLPKAAMTDLNSSPPRKSLRGGEERPTKFFLLFASTCPFRFCFSSFIPETRCVDVLYVGTIHMIDARRYSLSSTRSPLLRWPAGPTATPSAQHALRTCTGQKGYHAAFPSPRLVSRSALLFAPCTRPPMQFVRPSSAIFLRRSPRAITRLWFRPLSIGLHLAKLSSPPPPLLLMIMIIMFSWAV